jgi:uncharacterized protein (TIGR03546 family)
MVLGLVPKGNLIAVSLLVLLFSLRVNAGIGLLAAAAFSWIGPAIDPLAHRLGLYVLTTPSLQPTYASIFHWPLAPWFNFHNTIVTGSLLIGVWALYPAYWLSGLVVRTVRGEAPHEHEHWAAELADRRAA